MTEDTKLILEATVDEIGDLEDGAAGDDGAGLVLTTERGSTTRQAPILTGRKAIMAAPWLRLYSRVRVTIEPIDEGT